MLYHKVSRYHTASQKNTLEPRRAEQIEVRVRQKQNMYHDSLGISTVATVCTLSMKHCKDRCSDLWFIRHDSNSACIIQNTVLKNMIHFSILTSHITWQNVF